MKKISGIFLFICIALNSSAQLLWKISGNGLEKPSYIFGTHHLAPLSIKDSITNMAQVINETNQVYGEIIMSETNTPAFMQEAQRMMKMPTDTTLQSLFTSEQYELLGKIVKEYLMTDISMLAQVKPTIINLQLEVVFSLKYFKDSNLQQSIDAYFQQQAQQNGKKVGGLETTRSQLDMLFNRQTLQRQAQLLYCAISHIEKTIEQNKKIVNYYKAQDLDSILCLMEEKEGSSCDPLPNEMEILLDKRNKAWTKKMPIIMKEAPTLFVVGGGHLPGNNGVLNLLKQQGYIIAPMK